MDISEARPDDMADSHTKGKEKAACCECGLYPSDPLETACGHLICSEPCYEKVAAFAVMDGKTSITCKACGQATFFYTFPGEENDNVPVPEARSPSPSSTQGSNTGYQAVDEDCDFTRPISGYTRGAMRTPKGGMTEPFKYMNQVRKAMAQEIAAKLRAEFDAETAEILQQYIEYKAKHAKKVAAVEQQLTDAKAKHYEESAYLQQQLNDANMELQAARKHATDLEESLDSILSLLASHDLASCDMLMTDQSLYQEPELRPQAITGQQASAEQSEFNNDSESVNENGSHSSRASVEPSPDVGPVSTAQSSSTNAEKRSPQRPQHNDLTGSHEEDQLPVDIERVDFRN